jgi:hypothetical protein
MPADIMRHATQTVGGGDMAPICRRMPHKAFFLIIL